jgi:hypothetical protein
VCYGVGGGIQLCSNCHLLKGAQSSVQKTALFLLSVYLLFFTSFKQRWRGASDANLLSGTSDFEQVKRDSHYIFVEKQEISNGMLIAVDHIFVDYGQCANSVKDMKVILDAVFLV